MTQIAPNISKYDFAVEPFSEDCLGCLSWPLLGNLILRAATLHATEHGFGYKQVINFNHAWVLSRLTIDMDEMPRTAEAYSITTWVDRLYRQFTDRHFAILRPDGTAYGYATTVWALIDITSRRPTMLDQLPDGGFNAALVPDLPCPVSAPARHRMKNPVKVSEHRANYTDLDINGHVNSIRFVELLLARYSKADMEAHPVKRIEMTYAYEGYCGELLSVYEEHVDSLTTLYEVKKEDGTTAVKGVIIRR